VLAAVLARQSWPGLPVLRRIISTPVLRPNGTLLQTPGYDPATGFYLAANGHLDPIPDRPTPQQVDAAREFLLERFLRDFPWRSPADRANYLALLVTPLVRPFIRALAPFGMIEASMPGSGKTILAGCVGLLVGQRVLTWTDSEDELCESITTVLADSVGVVVFDNLAEGAVIDSAVLARLVTERTWTNRRLGTNAVATFPNDRLWLATGNNLRTGGNMASRTVWIRLDPNFPRPEAGTGFTIPNLDSWILDPVNRAPCSGTCSPWSWTGPSTAHPPRTASRRCGSSPAGHNTSEVYSPTTIPRQRRHHPHPRHCPMWTWSS
jgi:hypothetical protein